MKYSFGLLVIIFDIVITQNLNDLTCSQTKAIYRNSSCCQTQRLSHVPNTAVQDGLLHVPNTVQDGGMFTIGLPSIPKTINPINYFEVETDVYTHYAATWKVGTLYKMDKPNYHLVPSLAKNVVRSEDCVTALDPQFDSMDSQNVIQLGYSCAYTVELKDKKWSDGTAFTADDVMYTQYMRKNILKRGISTGNTWLSWYPETMRVEKTSSNTIKIFIKVPSATEKTRYSVFQSMFTQLNVLPRNWYKPKIDHAMILYNNDLVQVREHVLSTIDATRQPTTCGIDMDTYYYNKGALQEFSGRVYDKSKSTVTSCTDGEKAVAEDGTVIYQVGTGLTTECVTFTRQYKFDRLRFVVAPNKDTNFQYALDGSVNWIYNPRGLTKPQVAAARAMPNTQVITNKGNGIRYQAYNTRVFPTSSKAFRQSIICLTDVPKYLRMKPDFLAYAEPNYLNLKTWQAPLTGVNKECMGKTEGERQTHAANLLRTEGWTATDWNAFPLQNLKGPNGETFPNATDLTLKSVIVRESYDPIRHHIGVEQGKALRNFGIPIRTEEKEFNEIVDLVFTPNKCRNWYMYILGWGYGAIPDHLDNFFSTQYDSCVGGYNTPGFTNEFFDAKMIEYRNAVTEEIMKSTAKELQNILLEEVPYMNLFNLEVNDVFRYVDTPGYTNTLDGFGDSNGATDVMSPKASVVVTRSFFAHSLPPSPPVCADTSNYKLTATKPGGQYEGLSFTCAQYKEYVDCRPDLYIPDSYTKDDTIQLLMNCPATCGTLEDPTFQLTSKKEKGQLLGQTFSCAEYKQYMNCRPDMYIPDSFTQDDTISILSTCRNTCCST